LGQERLSAVILIIILIPDMDYS